MADGLICPGCSLCQGRDTGFVAVTMAQLGERCPDAAVYWDRDLAAKISQPFFVVRWEQLYVGSCDDLGVCWCWDADLKEWGDLCGGIWTTDLHKEWMRAAIAAPRTVR